MPKIIDKSLISAFLKKVILIEEEPTFLSGAQETARKKKIYDALSEICESEL